MPLLNHKSYVLHLGAGGGGDGVYASDLGQPLAFVPLYEARGVLQDRENEVIEFN